LFSKRSKIIETLLGFKIYCKSAEIKRAWYWSKDIYTDYWNRIGLEIELHTCIYEIDK
jgi:hypothetical protein